MTNPYKLFLLLNMAIGLQSMATPLAGTYTIGGTNPNYTTINAAIAALDSNGINAPVVFNIRNGNYSELLFFSAVAGASAANTITFQGESGDSSLVEINGTTTSNQQNTVRLNQIEYFTLKNVTVRQYPNVDNNAVIYIYRGKYCTISNCVLYGHQSGTSFDTEYCIQGCNDSGMVVRNCWLRGATSGNYFGNPFFSHRNLLVEDNLFNTSSNNIFIDGGAFATISGNTVNGRVLLQQTSRANIFGNKILNMLQLISSSGWALQRMKIYNNIITGGSYQGTVGYSFWTNNSTYYDFYNNTVYMNSPTMAGYAIYLENFSSGDVSIKNNIIYREDTSSANYLFRYVNAESSVGSIFSDHNLFFRNGTNITHNYPTLSAFTTGTGLDSNSVFADPVFTSSTNFYPTSTTVNNLAIPISYITTDYAGNARNTTNPTVGAYEVLSAPVAGIHFQNTSICEMENETLQANFSGSLPITFQWYKNGNILLNDTFPSFDIIASQLADSGTYYCIATNSLGIDTAIFHVTVNALPNTTVTLSNDTLTANLGNAAYQWIDCINDSAIVNETNQMFVPSINGIYAVIVSQNGCVDTSGCFNVFLTGIEPNIQHTTSNLFIYPNPAKNTLIVNSTAYIIQAKTIIILDILGNEVFNSDNDALHKINNVMCVDIQHLSKGIYFAKVGNEVRKFVKE